LFVRFFYTLSTQVHKGTAGAHALGQFRPHITRTGNGRHHLLSFLYKERKKGKKEIKKKKEKTMPNSSSADRNPT
jgi:hypothetical protein